MSKKKTKRLINKQIKKKAPGLDVNSATTADSATNASALNGVSLANLNPVAEGLSIQCSIPIGGDFGDCVPGASLTLNRTADVLVMVTATWYDGDADGVKGVCRIERNGATLGGVNEYGSTVKTSDGDQGNALAMNQLDPNLAPGTYVYNLACDEAEAEFELEDVRTTAVALGS